MKARVITFLVLLAAALGGYALTVRRVPEVRAKVQDFEQGFLDFLVANAYEAFVKAVPAASPDVVLVEFREQDKDQFEAWPPTSLDYKMLLQRLTSHDPAVVVFTEPLIWATETGALQLGPLRSALLPVPSVVLGFEVTQEAGAMSPEQAAFVTGEMPAFARLEGNVASATPFTRPTVLPDKSLRTGGAETGISRILPAEKSSSAQIPFVAYDGTHLVPSVAAQAVTRFRRTPFSSLRVRFGIGGRLMLGDEHIVPLDKGGAMTLADKPAVPMASAADLTSPIPEEAEAVKAAETVGRGKVLVIGTGQNAAAHARAIAFALAMPRLNRAPEWAGWAFAAWMALCCLRQWRYRRVKVLLFGVVLAVIAMVICIVTFQSSLWWWSPAPAAIVVAVSTLFCFFWPAPRPKPATEPVEAPPAPAAPPPAEEAGKKAPDGRAS